MTSLASIDLPNPLSFLDLAGHPVRWHLLRELARSDRRVDELVEVAAQPQSLVSYHLGRLRDGGLLTCRRSSKDGRATYYHLDLDTFGASLSMTGVALHPGLDVVLPKQSETKGGRRREETVRVLFACTGNSARSQIAEALLNSVGCDVDVVSAGSDPKPIHPLAVKALAARGLDISDYQSKPLSDFAGQHFDYVVSLCDKVRERCPEFVGSGEPVHWSIEDPSSVEGSERIRFERFQRLTIELDTRVRWLTRMIQTHHTTGGTPHVH